MEAQQQEFNLFSIEEMDMSIKGDKKLIENFTLDNGLFFDARAVNYTIALFNEQGDIIGTGSANNNTLKYVVVDKKYRDSHAFSQITSYLINKVLENYRSIFVYTHPKNIHLFEGLGFKLVAKAKPLFAMLEFGVSSINNYVNYLKKNKINKEVKKASCIVMNCNPLTKGHLYLIEKAAAESDILYLIIVKEDLSVFPFKYRIKLVKEATANIKNVIIVEGGHYVVSGATFPAYFLKDAKKSNILSNQAELDVVIFAKYIAKALGITHRYVGTEPNCNTTAAYNEAMKKLLPPKGIEVVEIERAVCSLVTPSGCGDSISASKIREAISNNSLNEIKDLVPEVTYNFLISEEAKEIIHKIKNTKNTPCG